MHPQLNLDLPRKRNRKLAQMSDAGTGDFDDDPIARFKCKRCGWDSDWIKTTFTECRRGTPCPLCNAPVLDMKPLFIPLKREHFEAFKSGEKETEFRPHGRRWNSNTCRIGRLVTLSLGYGKANRLTGRVVGFEVSRTPSLRPKWRAIYGNAIADVSCIHIHLEPTPTP